MYSIVFHKIYVFLLTFRWHHGIIPGMDNPLFDWSVNWSFYKMWKNQIKNKVWLTSNFVDLVWILVLWHLSGICIWIRVYGFPYWQRNSHNNAWNYPLLLTFSGIFETSLFMYWWKSTWIQTSYPELLRKWSLNSHPDWDHVQRIRRFWNILFWQHQIGVKSWISKRIRHFPNEKSFTWKVWYLLHISRKILEQVHWKTLLNQMIRVNRESAESLPRVCWESAESLSRVWRESDKSLTRVWRESDESLTRVWRESDAILTRV